VSILQGTCDSFRAELFLGLHAFGTDTINVALYQAGSASLSPSTTVYSSSGELVSTGYTSGGQSLINVTVAGVPGIAYVTFNAPTWTLPLIPGIDGCLLYNASKSNRAIAVLNFGTTRYPNNAGIFTIAVPLDPINNAILRLA
jgi:hypothetical protein